MLIPGFNIHLENPCLRALDHKKGAKISSTIVRNLVSHLSLGVLSRRERLQRNVKSPIIAEALARIKTGMYRQSQNEIYVLSPHDHESELVQSDDWRELIDSNSRKHDTVHRVYLLIDAPQKINTWKGNSHIIPASEIPITDRLIRGVIVRKRFLPDPTLGKICRHASRHKLMVVDEDFLTIIQS